MSDIASSSRTSKSSPVPGDSGRLYAENRPAAIRDDQPTVISTQPPVPVPHLSDAACRILEGKILPGDRLGHFELVQYIGGGGMGRVVRGVDTRLRRTVALKIISPEQAADEETLLRFQNEAQSAARLDHENIARVYHVGEDQGLHYIVFEFVEGVNIRALVERNGPLPLAEAVSYTLQVAQALMHADARNVVHRDVKPSNLLITPEGQLKLIDMGLARLRRLDSSDADLTASGVTLGTFDYIAPEQARDPRNADVRSDIYSLGCTFFYMLAGRPPFPQGTVLQKLLQHQGDEPPDIRQFRNDLPDEAARLLRKMLAKDPRHRYRDSAELVEELMVLAYQIGLRPAAPTGRALRAPRGERVPFFQRHLPWIAPVAALVCIAVVLHVFPTPKNPSQPTWGPSTPLSQQDGPQTPAVGPDQESSPPEDDEKPARSGETDTATAPAPEGPSGSVAPGQDPAQPGPPPPDLPEGTVGPEPGNRTMVDQGGGGTLRLPPLEGRLTLAEDSPPALSILPEADAVSGELAVAPGAAFEPGVPPQAPGPAASRPRLLVVSDEAQGENEFLTLQAACRAAVTGDVIELRYNGRRQQQPIALTKPRLTIRAGKGYQPVVVFRPDQTDPVKYPRSMFTVTAGGLALVNLAVELQVPRQIPAESWSLFETHGSQTIRLEKCSLSVCNASDQLTAYHPEVAFFRTRSLPDADSASGDHSPAALPPAAVDLVDCVALGEAVFLCVGDRQPVHLTWENGLLVTSEQLLRSYGSPRAPELGEMLRVDLRNLTAVVRGGLCRMTQTLAAPFQLDTRIYCGDGILMAAPGAPLIEQECVESLEDPRHLVAWSGDRNFYEHFDVFWRVRNLDQQDLCQPMTFGAWQEYWGPEDESLPLENSVIWKKLPDPARALHTHGVADYALAASTDGLPNPARDAGFQADRFPGPPALPDAEKSRPEPPN